MSRESGKLVGFPKEAEKLRDLMSRVTRAKYEIKRPAPNFPPRDAHSSWFVIASELTETERTAASNAGWKDSEGKIFIESETVGYVSDWIERQYGENGAVAAGKLDFGDFNSVREAFARQFPATDQFLKRCERIVVETSSKYDVDISMRCDGDKGVAIFYLDAKIRPDGGKIEDEEEKIAISIRALKEALRRIDELNLVEATSN